MRDGLRLLLRTPHEDVFDGAVRAVRAVRVPTETGQAGLRPGGERILLVVEPGLVLLRDDAGLRFEATAGGLLESGSRRCTLYTPVAVVGASELEVLGALDRLLSMSDREVMVRRQLGDLEARIVQELSGAPRPPGSRRNVHERPVG